MILEYDGTNYAGFQKQFNIKKKSISEVIENAIFLISKENVKITVAGRTDSGVHALGQVIHFDLTKEVSAKKFPLALNSLLKNEDISVLSCDLVDQNFHARFNAKSRYYRYVICNRLAKLVLQKNRAYHIPLELDIQKMKVASKFLIGQHDFSSFRDSECQSSSPIRTVDEIKIIKECSDQIYLEFKAKSFLHHMVRNIVGTLVWVGSGKINPQEIKNILDAKNRRKSGPNAPACGLYFLRVDY
jgi:tRNA pseudouridine38-40 synthase